MLIDSPKSFTNPKRAKQIDTFHVNTNSFGWFIQIRWYLSICCYKRFLWHYYFLFWWLVLLLDGFRWYILIRLVWWRMKFRCLMYVYEMGHNIFHLWKMFSNPIINNNNNNNNKHVMIVMSVGPEKWRIDKPNSKFSTENGWSINPSKYRVQYKKKVVKRQEKAAKNTNVSFMVSERSPEGTEVRTECHKCNDIQFICPIVCFYRWFNTENFLLLYCVR